MVASFLKPTLSLSLSGSHLRFNHRGRSYRPSLPPFSFLTRLPDPRSPILAFPSPQILIAPDSVGRILSFDPGFELEFQIRISPPRSGFLLDSIAESVIPGVEVWSLIHRCRDPDLSCFAVDGGNGGTEPARGVHDAGRRAPRGRGRR